jgi:hypothetical protein
VFLFGYISMIYYVQISSVPGNPHRKENDWIL